MIIMIPMLCSNTVNYSAVPGIAKAMERNILIHGLDFALDLQNKEDFKTHGGKLEINENFNINTENFHILDDDYKGVDLKEASSYIQEELKDDPLNNLSQEELKDEYEQLEYKSKSIDVEGGTTKDKEKAEEIRDKQKEIEDRLKELESRKKQVVDSSARVSLQMEAMSLEPTWMHVDRIVGGKRITDLLGIKVLPFMIQSDEKLINLLMYDKNLNNFDSKIVSLGRKIRKNVYDLYKRAMDRIPVAKHFLSGRKSVSGDARKDVILAKSSFKKNVVVCVNKLDFEDDFFKSTSSVNKLFKMGWNSIIAMDDSQKTAYFCLQEFKGICFPVQYSYIFSTLGKEQKRVFDDLNDLKKSSGGLFRRKIPKRKLMENEIRNKYIQDKSIQGFANLEQFVLTEGIKNQKETLDGIRDVKDFINVLETGDKHKIQANLKRKTKYKDFSQVKKDMVKYPGFKKGYDLGKSNFKKKFDFKSEKSMRILESLAVITGIYAFRDYVSGNMSSMKHSKNFMNKLEKNINKNIKKVEKSEKTQDPDYILGMATFGAICLAIAPIILVMLYTIVTHPEIFTGIFKLVIGAIMFILLTIHWIIFDFLAPVGNFFINIGKFTKETFEKISDLIELIKKGVEKADALSDKIMDMLSSDIGGWLF